MPTYEYRCPEGHDFEKFYKKISDAESQVACPTCGKVGERRMSDGAGLVFKGSGFYITDYGKDGKKPQSAPSTEKKESSGSGDSGSAANSSAPAPSTPSAPKSTE